MRSSIRRVARFASIALVPAASFALGCGDFASQSRPDGASGRDERPNVLLVTIDTLRADYVHSYGFAESTTPNIDALAARGALFEWAIAASTATVPSHASIMTSRYVREHSVGAENGSTRLEGLSTLADSLREAGYETAAFVSNVVLKARTGLDRGFSLYDDELPVAEQNRAMALERTADQTGARAVAWLESPRDAPFFLWVHLQDPHGPYTPPSPYDELVPEVPLRVTRPLLLMRGNRGRGGLPSYQAQGDERRPSHYAGRYAGEVSFADAWVGRVLEAAERDASRPIVALLTADHGESLDENGFFFQHGHATTPEQARVPFIVVAPGVAPTRVRHAVSHVDVAPTLLELVGLAALAGSSGISLVPHLRDGAPLPPRVVFSDIGSELAAYDDEGYLVLRPSRARATDAQDIAWQRFDRVESQIESESGSEESRGVTFRAGAWRKGRRALLPSDIVAYLSDEVPLVPAHAMSDADVERLRQLGYLAPVDADRTTRDPSGASGPHGLQEGGE